MTSPETHEVPAHASPVDTAAFGRYRLPHVDDEHPLIRFTGRVTADGSSGFRAEPGRYHLYGGLFCPWSHRATIVRRLRGLDDVVSLSYVDDERDGRGWAFRATRGADPVNGFRLLRQAYEATEPGFAGHVSVPALWDRERGRLVSNHYGGIDLDLATQFAPGPGAVELVPDDLADDVDALDGWIGPAVNHGAGAASGTGPDAEAAREALQHALSDLDARLAGGRYLLGDRLTLADVRLWVTLVRYRPADGAPALVDHEHLWAYARDLYALPAFRETTDFASFGAADAAAAWDVAPVTA
ncbi:glutathione S-transferase C-terminal domain-containing protein [Angustibacter aerolatus]|uniref:GST C-terminal domain-containing protein n=1 Tax=Angustibacter aerolatus TaxID=1162965 RepID=A0ABQ6JDQ4_9ACTN|nr:glutathione S-transferase C-terminal domain-containing protein [Angustibacter aerolatus]GMA85340.1 hypothetical protein GCM10025868_05900 [Angustibacter aerolatus]